MAGIESVTLDRSVLEPGRLQMCRESGLVNLGHVALDGTKMRAPASQSANLRYRQLPGREQALNERVRQLLDEAALSWDLTGR